MFRLLLVVPQFNHASVVSTLQFTHVLWLGAQERGPFLLIVVMLAALLFSEGRSLGITRYCLPSPKQDLRRIVAVSFFEADASPTFSGTGGSWPQSPPRSVPSMRSLS